VNGDDREPGGLESDIVCDRAREIGLTRIALQLRNADRSRYSHWWTL